MRKIIFNVFLQSRRCYLTSVCFKISVKSVIDLAWLCWRTCSVTKRYGNLVEKLIIGKQSNIKTINRTKNEKKNRFAP